MSAKKITKEKGSTGINASQIPLLAKIMSDEKGIEIEEVFTAIEVALASIVAKQYPEDASFKVRIDHKTGEMETVRIWTVVDDTEEELELPNCQMMLSKAQQEIDADLSVDDVVEEPMESADLSRVAASYVRGIIANELRKAQRTMIARQYSERIGELVTGVVKRVTREHITLDMGDSAEALLLREEMIAREAFRMGDRVRGVLYDVDEERRGPLLLLSRTRSALLMELFKIEVPEIGEEVIEIKAAARDAGSRAKIAVKTNDGRIDPIGACVGMRGSRVQAVSNELNGERVDIVLWDDNPAQLVINSMAPAEVASIMVDEDTHTMDIAVKEEQLSQAIGRGGQNIRLASELTGWTLNVMTEAEAADKESSESDKITTGFVEKLGVDAGVGELLMEAGFTSMEEIAYTAPEDMLKIASFDAETVDELQRRAMDIVLTQEIASEEEISAMQPEQVLLDLDGMTEELANQLAAHGVVKREDLAEMAVVDLQEIVEMDDEAAGKLIMAARAHWFSEEK